MISALNITIPIYQLLFMFDIGVTSFLDPEANKENISAESEDGSSGYKTPITGATTMSAFDG